MMIIVFIIGIIIGKNIESSKPDEITDFIKQNELNTESFLIEWELIKTFDSDSCDLASGRIISLSAELYQIGQKLVAPDADKILGKETFSLLKRRYHLTQIKTYFLFSKLLKNCEIDQHIILFYYGADSKESSDQGPVLDELVAKYPLNVFALEYNYSTELNFLESYYNISETPAIVVDYEHVLIGPQSLRDIELLLIQPNKPKN